MPNKRTHSGPFRRAVLLKLKHYIASNSFGHLATWDRSNFDDLYVLRGSVGRSEPARMVIVGVVSSDPAYLHPHGNWNPEFARPIKKAKLQFTLNRPSHDPDFDADYDLALKRLAEMQKEVSKSDRQEHFIQSDGRLTMNFQLFIERGVPDDVEHHEGDYDVDDAYRSDWKSARKNLDIRIMPVWDTNKQQVDYTDFSTEIRAGATVEVTFTLRHYAFKDKTTKQVTSDTFTAQVHSVFIHKSAPPVPKSSKSSKISKKRTKQPPSRSEQKAAADAFVNGNTSRRKHSTTKSTKVKKSPSPEIEWPTSPEAEATDSAEDTSASEASSASEEEGEATPTTLRGDSEEFVPQSDGAENNFINPAFDQLIPYILEHIRAAGLASGVPPPAPTLQGPTNLAPFAQPLLHPDEQQHIMSPPPALYAPSEGEEEDTGTSTQLKPLLHIETTKLDKPLTRAATRSSSRMASAVKNLITRPPSLVHESITLPTISEAGNEVHSTEVANTANRSDLAESPSNDDRKQKRRKVT